MEERMQQMEEMKHAILTQVLDQSARARCKFTLLSISLRHGIITYIYCDDSEYFMPWKAWEGQNGRRDAPKHGTTRTAPWQTWREGTNQFTRKCESTDAKEDNSQS